MIITTRMIRDKLAFKGPMPVTELMKLYNIDLDTITKLLTPALMTGEIHVNADQQLETTWQDDVE